MTHIGRMGGQYQSPLTLRDKLLGGGGCVLVAWLAVWLAFYFEAVPIVTLCLAGFAIILTAYIGGAVLAHRGKND